MKKTALIIMALLAVSAIVGTTTGCGPSAEEKARMDSIRVADSLQRVDSIHHADSVAKVAAAAQQIIDDSLKVDSVAKKFRKVSGSILKLYDQQKVVYGERLSDHFAVLNIYHVPSGTSLTVDLPGSEYLGRIANIKRVEENEVQIDFITVDGKEGRDYYKVDINNAVFLDHWHD